MTGPGTALAVPLLAAGLLGAAIALPHFLRLDAAPPVFAAGLWLCALALRGVASLLAAVALELFVPATRAYEPLAGVCALGVGGHALGDALLAVPAFVLAGSLIAVLLGLWRAARRVQRLVRAGAPGTGGSVVVADGELLVAAAGLLHPHVLVSAGALIALDDEELAASLDHERGHIAHRHRYVVAAGEIARSVGRFLPGTRAAAAELLFHLERDADRYALARRHDPAVLASAICKAAQHQPPHRLTLALGGGLVARRARQLLDSTPLRRPSIGVLTLVPAMIVLLAASAAVLPLVAHETIHHGHRSPPARHC